MAIKSRACVHSGRTNPEKQERISKSGKVLIITSKTGQVIIRKIKLGQMLINLSKT